MRNQEIHYSNTDSVRKGKTQHLESHYGNKRILTYFWVPDSPQVDSQRIATS